MQKNFNKRIIAAIVLFVLLTQIFINVKAADNVYYMGDVQVKSDSSYARDKEMKESDPHYGWKLGQFMISGFTRKTEDDNNNPVFLKTVGDQVKLTFELQQNIDVLNGNESLSITEDVDGYDNYFGISENERTNFGKGALLVMDYSQ